MWYPSLCKTYTKEEVSLYGTRYLVNSFGKMAVGENGLIRVL
jgi:hypothetical protein